MYRAPAPYPYRGIGTGEAILALERLFESEVDPAAVACVVLEPVQGEGGFIPMPPDYLAPLRVLCDRYRILAIADDELDHGLEILESRLQTHARPPRPEGSTATANRGQTPG